MSRDFIHYTKVLYKTLSIIYVSRVQVDRREGLTVNGTYMGTRRVEDQVVCLGFRGVCHLWCVYSMYDVLVVPSRGVGRGLPQ